MDDRQNSDDHLELHAHDGDNSTRCDGCKSCGAVLELDCGHRFHPRCVYAWPATHCEVCNAAVTVVRVFRQCQGPANCAVRKGKWSIDEHKYADVVMKQFQLGALPLPNGLHLRVFMANMLQCDPLRITKKYAGQGIGKQNYLFQHKKSYCYNLHIKLQKQVSNLRNHFYWHIQYRCKLGHKLNIQELKAAEADYWIREFRKFAAKIGQNVELCVAEVAEAAEPKPVEQTESIAAPADKPADSLFAPKSVSLPPTGNLGGSNVCTKIETAKKLGELLPENDDGATMSAMKDKADLMVDCAGLERSESPVSADEWSDPSSFADMVLADATSVEEAVTSQDMIDFKKKAWVVDLMKESEIEWSKGAISWSLSLSSEPLSDFA